MKTTDDKAVKVGSKIWHFDPNRRVYPPAPKGKLWASGGPIYREHWHEVEITGETSRSWLTAYGKVPKSGEHRGFAFTIKEVEDDCWLQAHRYQISRAVEQCTSPELLREIAFLLNFTPTP